MPRRQSWLASGGVFHPRPAPRVFPIHVRLFTYHGTHEGMLLPVEGWWQRRRCWRDGRQETTEERQAPRPASSGWFLARMRQAGLHEMRYKSQLHPG